MPDDVVASPARTRRPRADAQRSIDRILQAAVALIERQGPTITLEEVAGAAGVAPATLYRHFPSRMHLFERIHLDQIVRFAARAPDPGERGDPREALARWLREFIALTWEMRGVLAALLAQGLQETDPGENSETGRALVIKAVGDLLVRACGTEAARAHADAVVMLTSGLAVAVEARRDLDDAARQAMVDTAVAIIVNGI